MRGHPRPERRTGYWTARARRVIDLAVQDWLEERGLRMAALVDLGEADRRALRRYVLARYPFGERSAWPYQVWLREVRDVLAAWTAGPAPPPPSGALARRARAEAAGQMAMDV